MKLRHDDFEAYRKARATQKRHAVEHRPAVQLHVEDTAFRRMADVFDGAMKQSLWKRQLGIVR